MRLVIDKGQKDAELTHGPQVRVIITMSHAEAKAKAHRSVTLENTLEDALEEHFHGNCVRISRSVNVGRV